MQLQVDTESWAYKVPFRVSRGAESALDVVVVTLTDSDGHVGRGEAAGVDYDGEPFLSSARRSKRFDRQSSAWLAPGGAAPDRAAARLRRPGGAVAAGGARNAVDCALWI